MDTLERVTWNGQDGLPLVGQRLPDGNLLVEEVGGRPVKPYPVAPTAGDWEDGLRPHRPVLRYHGGKWRLAPWIISHFPAHRVYVEPYAGAASVLMRKERARKVEVINDLDGELINLFRVLRDPVRAEDLRRRLALTPYARQEFELSYEPADDVVEQARRTVVRAFQGFGSDSACGALTGFRSNGNRQNSHPARDWVNYPDACEAFTARLRGVVIESRPALEIISQHDGPETLYYIDPTYVSTARSTNCTRSGKGYRHEMTDGDHRELAAVNRAAQGYVIISGYPCALYDEELYPDWHRVETQTHADGAIDRTEVLWLSPRTWEALEREQAERREALGGLFAGAGA